MFDPKNVDPDLISFQWLVYGCREEPSAEDYLEFARQDLADGHTPRHLINGLANAKRALHLRMEDVCLGFGAVSLSNLKNFHRLAEYIKKCGLPAPSVLEKLNKSRNSSEHEYTIPTLEMVEIYTDVAYLFLSATDRWSARHPCDIDMDVPNESGDKNLRHVCFDWQKGTVTLRIRDKESKAFEFPHSITYTNKQPQFFEWVAFAVKHSS